MLCVTFGQSGVRMMVKVYEALTNDQLAEEVFDKTQALLILVLLQNSGEISDL